MNARILLNRFRLTAMLTMALPLCAQTTVTLKGGTYALQDHPRVWFDGPTGPLTTSLARKAVVGNLPWDAMSTAVAGWVTAASGTQISTNATGKFPKYALTTNRGQFEDGTPALQAALVCYAGTGAAQSDACAMADWLLNHIESYIAIGACDEALGYCGVSQEMADVGSKWMSSWVNAYTLIRSRLSTAQRQYFADKILNDIAEWGGIGGLTAPKKGLRVSTRPSTPEP